MNERKNPDLSNPSNHSKTHDSHQKNDITIFLESTDRSDDSASSEDNIFDQINHILTQHPLNLENLQFIQNNWHLLSTKNIQSLIADIFENSETCEDFLNMNAEENVDHIVRTYIFFLWEKMSAEEHNAYLGNIWNGSHISLLEHAAFFGFHEIGVTFLSFFSQQDKNRILMLSNATIICSALQSKKNALPYFNLLSPDIRLTLLQQHFLYESVLSCDVLNPAFFSIFQLLSLPSLLNILEDKKLRILQAILVKGDTADQLIPYILSRIQATPFFQEHLHSLLKNFACSSAMSAILFFLNSWEGLELELKHKITSELLAHDLFNIQDPKIFQLVLEHEKKINWKNLTADPEKLIISCIYYGSANTPNNAQFLEALPEIVNSMNLVKLEQVIKGYQSKLDQSRSPTNPKILEIVSTQIQEITARYSSSSQDQYATNPVVFYNANAKRLRNEEDKQEDRDQNNNAEEGINEPPKKRKKISAPSNDNDSTPPNNSNKL